MQTAMDRKTIKNQLELFEFAMTLNDSFIIALEGQ